MFLGGESFFVFRFVKENCLLFDEMDRKRSEALSPPFSDTAKLKRYDQFSLIILCYPSFMCRFIWYTKIPRAVFAWVSTIDSRESIKFQSLIWCAVVLYLGAVFPTDIYKCAPSATESRFCSA